MGKVFHFVFLILICLNSAAQYSPPAGQEGSTAIHKDSSIFIDWATNCIVDRGYMNVSLPDSGFVSAGDAEYALGQSNGMIVSLGDGGNALLTFDQPIKDGSGPDFAVFENGFTDDFLELAFVEVSSDGINFFRFDAVSLTQANNQIGSFGVLDATKIQNFAGKFRIDYGVPFDIAELNDDPLFKKDSIVFVKVVDVVGCIQEEFVTYDSEGNMINDPWPTDFESGGFDLDAVGVINNTTNSIWTNGISGRINVYPNPAKDYINIHHAPEVSTVNYIISDIYGKQFMIGNLSEFPRQKIDVQLIPAGLYVIRLCHDNCTIFHKFIKK